MQKKSGEEPMLSSHNQMKKPRPGAGTTKELLRANANQTRMQPSRNLAPEDVQAEQEFIINAADMGFTREQARAALAEARTALAETNGNTDAAWELLLEKEPEFIITAAEMGFTSEQARGALAKARAALAEANGNNNVAL